MRQRDRLEWRRTSTQDLHEKAHGSFADLPHRLGNCRQGWVHASRKSNVVKAEDGQIHGHAKTVTLGCFDHSHCHFIVEAKDSRRWILLLKKPFP